MEPDEIRESFDEYMKRMADVPILREAMERMKRPKYYHRDGTPIVSDELLQDTMKWALLFEGERNVAVTKTLYNERLSTVFLGLDHNWGESGPPIIFETMLFAPRDRELARRGVLSPGNLTEAEKAEIAASSAYIEKYYPDDQLQFRYSTEQEAIDNHNMLRLQCLIPPRWRHFLLWTIGQDARWRRYDDEREA